MEERYSAMFNGVVPRGFIEDTIRLLYDGYSRAENACAPLTWQVAHGFRGHERRKNIEEGWPALGIRHGAHVSYRPNRRRSHYYAYISFENVVLTESFVATCDAPVRRAIFRQTLARSNQRDLFEEVPPVQPGTPLYALLLHGTPTRSRQPWFAHVVFPAPDGTYLERIDLFRQCSDLVADLNGTTVEEEVIPDQATPELRQQSNRQA